MTGLTSPRDLSFAPRSLNDSAVPKLTDLNGLWTRSLIAWPDGRQDTTSRVVWLQGDGGYIDLRQPASLPAFPALRCLNDLTLTDCLALATQQGFAGSLHQDGTAFVWERELDYQPAEATPDSGFLAWEGDMLVETGRHQPYVEHWHREQTGAALPTPSRCRNWQADDGVFVRLRERNSGFVGMALRVGPYFMFAQERCPGTAPSSLKVTQPQGTLAERVAASETLGEARHLVACEISFGHIGHPEDTPVIARSTLPWRVGHSFYLRLTDEGGFVTPGQTAEGDAQLQLWDYLSPDRASSFT